MTDTMPSLEYAPIPCPRCGAKTYREADTICQPSQDQSGDYDCPIDDQPMNSLDDIIRQATPESLKALDDWYRREALREDDQQNTTQEKT